MSAWPFFALVSGVALIVAARTLGRAFALRRALSGDGSAHGGESWIIGRVADMETTPRWLADERAGWVEREVVVEILPRPGRHGVDARFQSNDTVVEERTEQLRVDLDGGRTAIVDVPGSVAIEGLHIARQHARSVDELADAARSVVERAAPDLKLDRYQRLAVYEEWLSVGDPLIVRGRIETVDGERHVRRVSMIEAGDPRRAVHVYAWWGGAWAVICVACGFAATFYAGFE